MGARGPQRTCSGRELALMAGGQFLRGRQDLQGRGEFEQAVGLLAFVTSAQSRASVSLPRNGAPSSEDPSELTSGLEKRECN